MSIESRCDSRPWNLWRAIFGPILLVRPSSLRLLNLGALHDICPVLRLKPNSLLFKRHKRASGLPTPQAEEVKSKKNVVALQLAAPVKRTKAVREGEGKWPWPSARPTCSRFIRVGVLRQAVRWSYAVLSLCLLLTRCLLLEAANGRDPQWKMNG